MSKIDMSALEVQEAIKEAVKEATEGLANKNQELLNELKPLKAKKDVDLDEFKRLQDVEHDLDTKRAEAKGDFEKLKEKLEAKHKKAIESLTGDLDSEKAVTHRLLVDNGLNDALVKANVAPHFIPAVKAMMKGDVDIESNGTERSAVVKGIKLSDHITEWAQTDEGKHYIKAPDNSGGGAQNTNSGGKSEVNPWAKDTRNLTRQAEINKSDPAKAERLKAAA